MSNKMKKPKIMFDRSTQLEKLDQLVKELVQLTSEIKELKKQIKYIKQSIKQQHVLTKSEHNIENLFLVNKTQEIENDNEN